MTDASRTSDEYNLRWNDGDTIHACKGARMVPFDAGTFLIWTKCGRDVPANAAFKADISATCGACNE